MQVAFIDLALGGKKGETCYPIFFDPASLRGIKYAVGQPILQAHDREQLRLNIQSLKDKM